MKVKIYGHHNSEFRQVTRTIKDKEAPALNLIAALMAGIRYEGDYRGWMEEESGCFIGKARIKLAVEQLAAKAVLAPTKEHVVVLHAIDEDTHQEDPCHGISIWAFVKEANYGFGEVHKREEDSNPLLMDLHGDKYENRWIDIVK
jgi:hypothetical protein